MGELIGIDGKRLSNNGTPLETPDIAAAWHMLSTKIAMDNGIAEQGEICHFSELHPVMQVLICETVQQMIDLGFIVPGFESAILSISELAGATND